MRRLRPAWWWLAPLLAGAALRFVTLGHQSLWNDEFITLDSLHGRLGSLLHNVQVRESSPPLYWYLAWFWTRVFGFGAFGLRSLSAIFGVASIAVGAGAGRTLAGRRAGAAAAWVVACAPVMVWYSQEGRAYSLFALLCGLSVWLLLSVRRRPSVRLVGLWTAVNAAALATHYFAGFLIGAELCVLLIAPGAATRRTIGLGGLVLLAEAVPLGLLARAQFVNSGFIRAQALPKALAEAGGQMLVGYGVDAVMIVAGIVTAIGFIGGAWYLARTPALRRGLAPIAFSVLLAVLAPLALAFAGEQLLDMRNLLFVLPAGALVAGVAATRRIWPAALVAAAGLVVIAHISLDPTLQRTDYRGAAAALGQPTVPRVILVRMSGPTYVGEYLRGARPIGPRGVRAAEIAVLGMTTAGGLNRHLPPLDSLRLSGLPAFTEVERRGTGTFTLRRYRAVRPVVMSAGSLAQAGGGDLQILFQPARYQ